MYMDWIAMRHCLPGQHTDAKESFVPLYPYPSQHNQSLGARINISLVDEVFTSNKLFSLPIIRIRHA